MVEQRDNSIEDVKAESPTSYHATPAVEPEFPTSYAGTLARMRGTGPAAGPALPSQGVPDPMLTQQLMESFDRRGEDYFFRNTDRKAFSDRGGKLTSKLDDRDTIAGMLTCAEAKGWNSVHVKGSEQFRRQAWFAAKQRGLDVTGYEPTREEASLFPAKAAAREPAQRAQTLNAIERGPAAAGTGAIAKALTPEQELAGVVPPARIDASLDEAHKKIAEAMGDKAKVFRAETRAGNYRGEIIGETQMHVIQRISPRMVVIHNKVDVAGGIIGQRGVYAYKGGRAKFAANREQQLEKAGIER